MGTAIPPVDPAQLPAQVRAARDAVLALPEFDVAPDWQSRVIDSLLRWFEQASAWLPASLRIYALLVILCALVAFVLWLLPARLRDDRAGGIGTPPAEAGPRFDAGMAAARAALAAGHFGESVRAAWQAAVSLLEETGISRAGSARADWEHVEAARRRRADLGAPLAQMATAFQSSHFGARPVGRAEAEACLALLAGLQNALVSHG